jgi:hypothetical protein
MDVLTTLALSAVGRTQNWCFNVKLIARTTAKRLYDVSKPLHTTPCAVDSGRRASKSVPHGDGWCSIHAHLCRCCRAGGPTTSVVRSGIHSGRSSAPEHEGCTATTSADISPGNATFANDGPAVKATRTGHVETFLADHEEPVKATAGFDATGSKD